MSKLLPDSYVFLAWLKTGARFVRGFNMRLENREVPYPEDEAERLAQLRQYGAVEIKGNEAFDTLTRLAANSCQTPIAAIVLVDEDRCWIESKVGWEAVQTDRQNAFCAYTILAKELFVVPDALADPRFAETPLVRGSDGIRFYAGVPLIAEGGQALGSLCVMDRQPRQLDPTQQDLLRSLAGQVMAMLELHRTVSERERNSELQNFLDHTHDLVQTVGASDRRLLWVNRAWQQTLGYSATEARQLSWTDLLDPVSLDAVEAAIAELGPGETSAPVEVTLSGRSGQCVLAEGVLKRDRDPNSETEQIWAIWRDVTAEKQARSDYQQLFENAAIGLFQLDRDGEFVRVNQALAELYGYDSPQGFLKQIGHIEQIYYDAGQWQRDRELLDSQGHVSRELEVWKSNDSTLWIAQDLRPLFDLRGERVGYEGFVQDLTTRKQAEATLQMAKDQLQAVLDAVPGTVSLISSNFHYLGVNRHLAESYNLQPDHFVGRQVGFRQSVFGQFVREFFSNPKTEASIEIDSDVNGNFRSDLVIAKKWLDDEAAVFVGIDITERKRAEAALQAELAEAAEYVRSLLPLPTEMSLHIDWRFIPSQQLGGDCFDYYWLDDDHLVLYLLDVSGHGSRAALLSVSVLNLLRSHFLPNTNFYQPREVLAALNQAIQMERQRNMYFTIWYGVYNRQKRELVYSSAGHPPAILISGDGSNPSDVQPLRTPSCLPIGMFPNAEYSNASCKVDRGSSLYIFSDGIYEIHCADESMWSLEAFIDLLATSRKQNAASVEGVLNAVRQLSAKETFDDDVSLLRVNF
ncbi:SpoIIE family protein phosphatase [Oxynema aestuarii]|uniref:SpoIIE family protein phosphatase n=1 Tax=Oxynema aestuarii AP17 TaxID=2064643 RepID=A0A6H1TXJ5_9CYAN|nr:SpoIIE family protein phosphatase [Oxynema aestuarii]QIZ71322.1 SpoIIE family protein phosphatase [Oxynema aestuarii AP17]RMH76592.1 MAG: PAS domain S-box protein [Cyanobacteria bacterium J007]